jgi:RNA polymerase sigma factor for flagellar operon FliA
LSVAAVHVSHSGEVVQNATQAYDQVAGQSYRDELILNHLPLVRHVLGRLRAQIPAHVDLENLESAGVLGLVEAANHFDRERGTQFNTYAYQRIRGAMLDELRRNSPLPQQMMENVALVRRAYETLPAPVTVDDLSAATGLTTDEVSDCLAAFRLTRMVSLEKADEMGVGTRLYDRENRPEAAVERAETSEQLTEALTGLQERERLVVTLYYLEDLRLKEIAAVVGLSESRVCRLLAAALFHLGEALRRKGVWDIEGRLR